MREVEKSDNVVDGLHEAIKLYLVKASKSGHERRGKPALSEILTFTTNLEHVGDIIDKNLMELAAKKIKNHYAFSTEGLDEIRRFHALVMDNMRLAFNVFATRDVAMARSCSPKRRRCAPPSCAPPTATIARLREGGRN